MGSAAERGQGMTSVCVLVQERVANDEEEIRNAPGNSEVCQSEIRKTTS